MTDGENRVAERDELHPWAVRRTEDALQRMHLTNSTNVQEYESMPGLLPVQLDCTGSRKEQKQHLHTSHSTHVSRLSLRLWVTYLFSGRGSVNVNAHESVPVLRP